MKTWSMGRGSGIGKFGFVLSCLIVTIALVLLVHVPARAAQLTVFWDSSPSPGVTGYKVYYGTQSGTYSEVIDAGNSTSCTVPNLEVGTTYYLASTAYDGSGDESGYSNELEYAVTGDATVNMGSGSGGGGGGCFIATAAFGSYLDPHVMVLRSFRDDFLLTNRLGKAFVAWYYATSPPYADAIRYNGPVKAGVRLALLPLIGFAYLCLATGIVPALVITMALLASLACGTRQLWVQYCAARGLMRR